MEDHTYHSTQEQEPPPSKEQTHREAKRRSDRSRAKSRINVGDAFPLWKSMRDHLHVKSDTQVAWCLLNSFKKLNKENARRNNIYTVEPGENCSLPQTKSFYQRLSVGAKMPRRRKLQPKNPTWFSLIPPIPVPVMLQMMKTQVTREPVLYTAGGPPTAPGEEEEQQ